MQTIIRKPSPLGQRDLVQNLRTMFLHRMMIGLALFLVELEWIQELIFGITISFKILMRHKPQNSEITFNILLIFRSLNTVQNLVNGFESNSQKKKEFSSTLSSFFSTKFLSEDLVGKVVEVLNVLPEEVKKIFG
jgi:hypothetical protein